MPFPMRIQPIDPDMVVVGSLIRTDKPVGGRWRFKRLFERQFSRTSSTEKLPCAGANETQNSKDGGDLEPSSVCLANMVQNFIEESNGNENDNVAKCGRSRCSCFNGNCSESSDDEYSFRGGDSNVASSAEACETLKNLITCATVVERNLLADITKLFVEKKNKMCKSKDECRRIVTDGLVGLGYNSSICKSRWEKTCSYPSGEYEYVDVVMEEGERLIVDVEFKSEFEIARSTGKYNSVLQSLPAIFVGKADRLKEIISIVSDAAKQSMKKKGMHLPPWRKVEYMKAKWFSPYTRKIQSTEIPITIGEAPIQIEKSLMNSIKTKGFSGEFELVFVEKKLDSGPGTNKINPSNKSNPDSFGVGGEEENIKVVMSAWTPPSLKPKTSPPAGGGKVIAGLASVLNGEN